MEKGLWARYQTPEEVQAHCRVVARVALLLSQQVKEPVSMESLRLACLMHDVVRPIGSQHAQKGADILLSEGYPEAARMIRQHHDLEAKAPLAAKLLYVADKLVQGVRIVPIEKRFEESRARCKTPDALAAWQRRYHDARCIVDEYGLRMGELK